MNNTDKIPILENFWFTTNNNPDSTLYTDQLGWSIEQKIQSGGYDTTKDVWDNLIAPATNKIVGWDLGFFYVPNRTFYYIDQMNKVLYKLPIKETDEPYMARVEIRPQVVEEKDELMDFEKPSEIWNYFTIEGKNMKYIIENSVLFLST